MIKGKVGDISALLRKLSDAPPAIEKGVQLALVKSTLEVHKEAIKGVQRVSSGEIQTRYNPKRQVVVSKAGDPFNSDTGRGIQSIKFEIDGNVGLVGSNLKYLRDLEFGTENMSARPWLAPALEAASKKIAEFMQDGINKSIQKAWGISNLVKDFNKLSKIGSKSMTKVTKKIKKSKATGKRISKKAARAFRKFTR